MSPLTPAFAAVVCAIVLTLGGCGEPPRPTINLDRAVRIGDLDQIERHLYWKTDADRPGPDGDYPLHVAARQGKVVIVRELLDHGVGASPRDRLGRTPLHLALANGKIGVADVLERHGTDEDLSDLLRVLVREGSADRDTIPWLVDEHGVDPNAAGDDGRAPLHLAVAAGQVKIAKHLIQAGADVNQVDAAGASPLAIAEDDGNDPAMVGLLQAFGARR
jgi:ankyrin repeat protein